METIHHATSAFIEKEEIAKLFFPKQDVLLTDEERKRRLGELQRAEDLGNEAHYKVVIVFEDALKKRKVETTIWDVKSDYIVLKGGVKLPVARIHKIKFE